MSKSQKLRLFLAAQELVKGLRLGEIKDGDLLLLLDALHYEVRTVRRNIVASYQAAGEPAFR